MYGTFCAMKQSACNIFVSAKQSSAYVLNHQLYVYTYIIYYDFVCGQLCKECKGAVAHM